MSTPCPGSDAVAPGFPGDSDRCPCCGRWVTIRDDNRFRRHRLTAAQAARLVTTPDGEQRVRRARRA